MRNSPAILCLPTALLVLAVQAAAQAPTNFGTDGQAPLFPTRQGAFDIPFQIDEPIPGQEPVEVQLHVSENRGSTWSPAAKARPQEGRFSFQAPRDGEYWFFVRTLNRQGRLLPERPAEAELRVLVDSVPPTLEASCTRGAAGEVTCQWKIADPTLKPETLELSYQGVGAGEDWRPVAAPPSQPASDAYVGRTTFVPIGVKFPLYVRIEVGDAAGNRATAQLNVEGDVAGPLALPPVAPISDAGGNPTIAASRGPWQSHVPTESPSTGGAVPYQPAVAPTASPPAPVRTVQQGSPPSMPAQFPGREAIPTPSGRPIGTPYRPTSEARTTPTVEPGASEAIAPGQTETLPTPELTGPQLPQFAGGADMPVPYSASSSTPELESPRSSESTPAPASSATTEVPPPGIDPRMVNSKRFELEYDVESIGPAGVAKVELWTTRDAGRTWTLSGADPDAASPYVVTVDEEGIYGFRIVVETTTGLRGATPKPGDLAEVWVGVDVTKPAVRITSMQQSSLEAGSGTLDIRWEAEERLMAGRPFVLLLGESSDGPWSTIASGLSGNAYEWRFDARTPDRLFLKLDARDAAGNVGTYVTPEPLVLERVKPQGRIRGVRPLGESARLRLPSQILPR